MIDSRERDEPIANVIWLYRNVLGREPESSSFVKLWASRRLPFLELARIFVGSDEFRGAHADIQANADRNLRRRLKVLAPYEIFPPFRPAIIDKAFLRVTPAQLGANSAPAVVTLVWDARAAGVLTVKIFTRQIDDIDSNETLFMFTAVKGTILTGPWVTGRTSFVIKDENEINVLAELAISLRLE